MIDEQISDQHGTDQVEASGKTFLVEVSCPVLCPWPEQTRNQQLVVTVLECLCLSSHTTKVVRGQNL